MITLQNNSFGEPIVAYNKHSAEQIATEIMSVDDVGVEIASSIMPGIEAIYSLEYLDKDTIKLIYSELVKDGKPKRDDGTPKYHSITEALESLEILDRRALYSPDFNYEGLIEDLFSAYQMGKKRVANELDELRTFVPVDIDVYDIDPIEKYLDAKLKELDIVNSSVSLDADAKSYYIEKYLDHVYRGIDDKCKFDSIIEVYEKYGLLSDPLLAEAEEVNQINNLSVEQPQILAIQDKITGPAIPDAPYCSHTTTPAPVEETT